MNSDFEIDFYSDNRYEELTVEISYKGQILCQLNKDKGINNVEVELFFDSKVLIQQPILKFPLNEFIHILNEAKQNLIAL